ncbi:hypothetical protein GCM10028809_04390 [Spirosoma gilvum]
MPHSYQLFPRDANNQAEVVISGINYTPWHTKLNLEVWREDSLVSLQTKSLAPNVDSTLFRFSSIIKAERAEYTFKVYAYTESDSSLIANQNGVVCGDVYIIHGQSNALALAELEDYYSFNFDDKYLRNAGYESGESPDKIAWYPAKQPYGSVGGFGLTLQRLILQNYGIPTCVLNGAEGGTGIDALMARDPNNHANPFTIYGDLLYRAQWAGVAKIAKAIIWRQGEEDAGTGAKNYAGKFGTLYNQFREDYGDMRIYVGQINILSNSNPQDSAAALRDFQRRTKYLYKNVETIATVGTPGYDGVHYGALAYQRLAFEQFRQIARDIYGSKDTVQINSPDIKRVFYNPQKDSVTMEFTDQLIWKNDTTFYNFATGQLTVTRYQKDYFYLDGQPGFVKTGTPIGNRVKLALTQASTAKRLRYLPAYFSDEVSSFYDGPTLRNARGMRAFSFDVPITDAIATVTTLAAKPLSEKQIQLNWIASAGSDVQILERSDTVATRFKQIAVLNGTTNTFTDPNLPNMYGTYYYRLRAYSSASESVYSNVVKTQPLVLGIEPVEPLVRLYPNPVVADRVLHVQADQLTFTDLTLRDEIGRIVKSWHGHVKNAFTLELGDLGTGLYIADLQTAEGHTLRRKIIVR